MEEHELALVATLDRFPELVESAAVTREPHQVAHYLRELANEFHVYYNAHKVIIEDDSLRDARLCLIAAVQQAIRSGLGLLGVDAPERM